MKTRFYRSLTAGQVILVGVIAIIVILGFMVSIVNYQSQVLTTNQDTVIHILQLQGNLSSHVRALLIDEFQKAALGGGFATKQDQMINHQFLENINETLSKLIIHIQQASNATNAINVTVNAHHREHHLHLNETGNVTG